MRNNLNQKESLEQRLRAEPPSHSVSPGFSGRVMDNLPGRTASLPPRTVSFFPRFALGFAALVVSAFVILQWARRDQDAPAVPELAAAAPVTATESLDLEIPRIEIEQFQALSMRLDDPLEKELQNVISDTRQAIQFVAANFLPEK